MKLSFSFIPAAFASLQSTHSEGDRKVPPRTPEQRLNRLNQFAEEVLLQHFSELPSQTKWIHKFGNNAFRMQKAFRRSSCGFFDPTLPHGGPDPDFDEDRYDRENPRVGVKQITTGYRKWAERYINKCNGQKKHKYQVSRMNRWNTLLQNHYNRFNPVE
ncbi:unnamed protein product [Oikopleura dioica]|uniref:Uncharacterized protein n=1 Tax=Oikopleura dioica TaxID=34765 RepID=E4Y5M3_OIKDI|nr:unnamed protein product [Oikopleura dioica]